MSMVLQIDGKIQHVLPEGCDVVKAVIVPGKLVNLLTSLPDPDKCITEIEENGVKRYEFGKHVPDYIKEMLSRL